MDCVPSGTWSPAITLRIRVPSITTVVAASSVPACVSSKCPQRMATDFAGAGGSAALAVDMESVIFRTNNSEIR
jgi:hypothetical protein